MTNSTSVATLKKNNELLEINRMYRLLLKFNFSREK